jgi:hypothetical protein
MLQCAVPLHACLCIQKMYSFVVYSSKLREDCAVSAIMCTDELDLSRDRI